MVYKVNDDAELAWRPRYEGCDAKKTDESGPDNESDVTRSALPLVIRRSTRRVGSQLEILLRACRALLCAGEVL